MSRSSSGQVRRRAKGRCSERRSQRPPPDARCGPHFVRARDYSARCNFGLLRLSFAYRKALKPSHRVPSPNESARPVIDDYCSGDGGVSDLELVLDAVEDARRVLAEYLEPGPRRPPDTTISMLVML